MYFLASQIASRGFLLYALGLTGPAQPERELEPPWAALSERPLNCTRQNRYEIWQFYEVGHQGRFRPRVIYSSVGTFYPDDGRPYLWMSNHPLDFMPRAVSP
jgi:hypothetical protein